MPFTWTLNPYRGCTHGCHYCFARRYQSYLELDADDEFSSVVLVKVNFPDVLRRELPRRARASDVIAFGTATDPYQPIEGRYQLTRRSLAALLECPVPVGLVTKGPLVVRDRDLLADLSARARCTVYVSVPTVDEQAWQRLEPGTASPTQRLRAVRELVDAGIHAGVLMSPVVPGITTRPAMLERTMAMAAESGARFIGTNLLHLEGGTRVHFMKFLERQYPGLVEGYERLYRHKYAAKPYAQEVRSLIDALQQRYAPRPRAGSLKAAHATASKGATPQPQQATFEWRA